MDTPLTEVNAARLARLVEISRILNSTTNLSELLTIIIREAAALTRCEAASILLLDPNTRQLHFKASSNNIEPKMADAAVPLDSSIAGAVLQANRPLHIPDVSRDPRWSQDIDQAIGFRTRAILGVPMRNVDREPVGVLEAINKLDGSFARQDVETLTTLADLAGVAVEKARLIEALQEANRELNELDQLKSKFIAVASHELRTPLSIILGYVSFLQEEAPPELADQLDSVLHAAVHLRTLIQDMLNFRYVEAGQAILDLNEFDFVELVRGVAFGEEDTAAAKEQTITVQLTQERLPVLADKNVMEVVLSNLVNNAVKFTPKGGQIDIHVERRGSEVWACVGDNGIGIPTDQLERIFSRFYQVESPLSRQYEGMGLGLAIARELTELHQGRVWAESDGNHGSKFFVALPLSTTIFSPNR
ncbi:MAG: ATP-binding protein [Anaerolineae bacterium]